MWKWITQLLKRGHKHDIFISYAKENTDIVENLRGQFRIYGIKAWVYSKDSILTEEVWREIESKILESGLFLYVASQFSNSAAGQQRELNFALDKRAKFKSRKIMPLTLQGVNFNELPEKLSKYTGRQLDINNIQSVAYNIATTIFPNIVKKSISEPWKYPVPGDWLIVSIIDEFIGNHVALGDKLYFRTLSPMGLFECYSPRLKGLFWIAPENVSISLDFENDKESELDIPREYKVFTMFEMMVTGWNIHMQNMSKE